ncbi:MAG: hypothetical protein C4520_21300 [Candidatus Abyssobacteria bacterium SURF_5]|uniref:Uncharacterized protein n=1 Tax=Abyssobacteria bacterium (strain SURF_5) TaxID=2093360 RepID=A0A3A4NHJ2_ABYX5|nr:MAG: hypothetical protein C4520_21300 [Candidatus Abyssubacteria bacterium SURF_5]
MCAECDELTPDFMRRQLNLMADVEMGPEIDANFYLFAGLISMMKMLQPEGYQQSIPAFIFHTIKE